MSNNALRNAASTLAKARWDAMSDTERSEVGRKRVMARWGRKERQMVTTATIRTRQTTPDEQRRGMGPVFRQRRVYDIHPDTVTKLLRVHRAEGTAGIGDDDLLAHASGRLRDVALLAILGEDTLRRTLVEADPDPVGDKLSAEAIHEQSEIISVVKKSIVHRPGRGMVAEEDSIPYRVRGGAEALRKALLKATQAGEIEPGAIAAMDAGRLSEGVLVKACPDARRAGFTLLKAARDLAQAAAELDDMVAEQDRESARR